MHTTEGIAYFAWAVSYTRNFFMKPAIEGSNSAEFSCQGCRNTQHNNTRPNEIQPNNK
jgi:hypothetical protein